jgi:hypothetical protein
MFSFCMTCTTPICLHCKDSEKHEGHTFKSVADLSSGARTACEGVLTSTRAMLEGLSQTAEHEGGVAQREQKEAEGQRRQHGNFLDFFILYIIL